MRRLLVVLAGAACVLAAAPGSASADVIFDPADAEELAATLAEAYEAQGVCYSWEVDVNNEGNSESSVGSNFGAGKTLRDVDTICGRSVEFTADIEWTPESSEYNDSASYGLTGSPGGPTVEDLDDLEIISEDGLVGDDVDSDIYKAVAALPLLAADNGLAKPLEASPAPETAAGDAAPTNSPIPDFWRESGMTVLWAALIMLAAVALGWYAIRYSRPAAPAAPAAPAVKRRPSARARRRPKRPAKRSAEDSAAEDTPSKPAEPDSRNRPDE